jgi:hypothetical protein
LVEQLGNLLLRNGKYFCALQRQVEQAFGHVADRLHTADDAAGDAPQTGRVLCGGLDEVAQHLKRKEQRSRLFPTRLCQTGRRVGEAGVAGNPVAE